VSVDLEPEHGELKRDGDAFRYSPSPGFEGKDAYLFKICADKGKTSGCSVVSFVVKVEAAAPKQAQLPADCNASGSESVTDACSRAMAQATQPAERLRALKWRGLAHFRAGDLNRAVADFSEAIKLKPDEAESYNNRGLSYQAQRDLNRAIADYGAAIRLDPKLVTAFINRCISYDLIHELARARADCDQAVALAPNFAGGYKFRAFVKQAQNDTAGARRDLDDAIRLAPDDADALIARGILLRGAGELDAALADYDAAVRAAPQYAGGYTNRGSLLLARNQPDRAAADFSVAIKLDPNNATARINRGLAQARQADYPAALADLDEGLRLAPTNPGAFSNRGAVHFAAGDFAATEADFARVAELQPDNPYAPLWRFIAHRRNGAAAPDALVKAVAAADSKTWPGPVLAFYAGKLPREAMEAAAAEGSDSAKNDQACELSFYLGEHFLLAGQTDAAVPLIKRAADSCPPSFFEATAAVGEWRRLQP
jgi:lipoprotein NlpI